MNKACSSNSLGLVRFWLPGLVLVQHVLRVQGIGIGIDFGLLHLMTTLKSHNSSLVPLLPIMS